MAVRFLKIAAVYFCVGVAMGLWMGATKHYEYASTHAHINLLGWASLALIGIIYHLFPQLTQTWLAKAHFWLHNLGFPIMVIGMIYIQLTGQETSVGPIVGAAGLLVTVGAALFTVNLLRLRAR